MALPDHERLASAAFRLKHDLGKAVRWSAPGSRETDPEELRARLGRDLLATRVGPSGSRSAVEIFDAWMSADGGLFLTRPADAPRLARISSAIDVLRERLPRLSELGFEELSLLDDAALVLQEESRALWRDVASSTPTRSPS